MDKRTVAIYIVLAIAAIAAYVPAREIMTQEKSWSYIVMSNITLNFALALFFYGMLMDRATKKMSKRKGWILWGVGFVAIVLFFRFAGGFTTIFG